MAKEYRLSIIVSGRDAGASSMLSGIGGSLRSIGQIAGGILTSQVFTFIAQQIGSIVTSAVSATAQMQTMEMMLTSLQARELIKSGDFDDMNEALAAAAPLAKATMDQLERIATLSPYQLQNVQNTYKMAMAFGYTSAEATLFTEALLNVGAGTGATNEMLDRMAYNLAQVRLQGKVTAMDIRQLAMAGFDLVDVLKYTGTQMGVNIETHEDFNKAIEQGKITWEDFTKYFAEYADKNFGGAAERMSRTLQGLKSTFSDVFLLTMPKILGPLAERVTGWMNGILNSFMEFADSGVLEEWGQNLADLLDSPYLKNGFLGLTQGFRNWAASVDWEQLSQDLAAGIDSIDWAMLGERTRLGAENIIAGLRTIFEETDWNAIFSSAGTGFMDFMAGLTNQESWANVKATWSANFMQLNQIITSSMDLIKQNSVSQAAAIGIMIPLQIQMGLVAGTGGIMSIIRNWYPEIEGILIRIKKVFEAQFMQMMQAAIKALMMMTPFLLEKLNEIMDLILGAIVPIVISISLPNFAALAAQAEAGMAMLNDALGGGGGGHFGGTTGGPRPGNSTGGNQAVPKFAGGGIARGPKSGYPVELHGTEAVIPLDGGHVPVSLNGALNPSGGNGMNFTFVFQYAPSLSTASMREAEDVIAPVLVEKIRTEFAKRGL